MKKQILLAMLCIFAMHTSFSQDNSEIKPLKNIFKFSVTNFFDHTFQASYERQTCDNAALMFSGGLLYQHNSSDEMSGFKFEAQYKYFVFTKEKETSGMKIYFAPYLFYRYTDKTDGYYMYDPGYGYTSTKYIFNSFSGGVYFGMGFTIARKISIDGYIGGGIKRTFGGGLKDNVNYYSSGITDPGYNGITPKGGIDVGFKF